MPFPSRSGSRSPLPKPDTCEPLKAAARRGDVKVAALKRGNYPGTPLPSGSAKELRLVGYWDAPNDQSWGLDWHCNEGVEFGLLETGSLPFAVDNRTYDLKAGSLTITRPWQRHKVGNPNISASRYHWLIIDVGVRRPNQSWCWPKWLLLPREELALLTRFLRHNEQPVWKSDKTIVRAFQKLGEAAGGNAGPRDIARLKLLINEILLALLDLLQRQKPRLDESLSGGERTVRLFLENLPQRLGELWTLESMAAECGMGRSHFGHHTKQITNRTPLELLNQYRIEAAAEMLRRQRDLNITQVAMECGFQSSQYFATAFKKQTGRTPREMRKKGAAEVERRSSLRS